MSLNKVLQLNNVDSQSDWVIIGRFGRPHGIKGFITVQSFTEPRDNILTYTDWHILINKKWQPINIIKLEVPQKAIIALVEGYTEREVVAQLTNAEIAIPRDKLAKLEPGEYYWHQLIGMKVINQKGDAFGKVVDIMATGANDVLVVKGDKRHLIPYILDKYVLDINESQQLITVDWDVDV